jgi:hypothetical protein
MQRGEVNIKFFLQCFVVFSVAFAVLQELSHLMQTPQTQNEPDQQSLNSQQPINSQQSFEKPPVLHERSTHKPMPRE